MFNMSNNLFDFVNWVVDVMNEKNISQSDIAKTGFVKPPAVSMFFALKTKSPGVEMCRAISAATGIPLEVVYRKAGLLPSTPAGPLSEEQQAVIHAVSQVKDNKTLRMISAMLDQAIAEMDKDKQRK